MMYCMKYKSVQDGRKDSYCITTDSSDNTFTPSLPFQCFGGFPYFLLLRSPFAFSNLLYLSLNPGGFKKRKI